MPNVKQADAAKILIVEDEKPLRELLRDELRRGGHRVQIAANGEEGLARYREEIYNVVLLDIRMPGSDGVEILKQMKSESSVPEIIMFTGHGTIETAVECIKHGAYDYLTKPVKLDELDLVITKAVEKNRLRLENINLKLEMQRLDNHQIVGSSPGILRVLDTVKRWGAVDEHVLIFGESGTGKELVARAVHEASPRKEKPFVTINCGRLDVHTAESELFGHMQGAFTSAVKGRAGLFELAHQGTLFMDEISEMTLDVQVKLLRILETGTFRRLGGNRDISVDVRFVFATNKKLEDRVEAGEFREDLFHRINMLPIHIPPLRERSEDILPLTWYFLKTNTSGGQGPWEIAPEAMAALRAYHWPGNVRELRNTIRRASILARERVISADLLPFAPPRLFPAEVQAGAATPETPPLPLWVIEREHIRNVLDRVAGNKSKAAKILEIDRKTLYTKLERYGLPA
ncbi:sigma-54-dependent transcriptional regulator [Geoalkalibacter halelectricus]|uniref:sigma-54-dependent transcriptional regulator n=1 Tax=Geoalkalibacter halelectricus TaxID=2847045 RepID=UPI003D1FE902